MSRDMTGFEGISSSRHVFPFIDPLRSSMNAMTRAKATERWNRTTSASELIFFSGTVKGASKSTRGNDSRPVVAMKWRVLANVRLRIFVGDPPAWIDVRWKSGLNRNGLPHSTHQVFNSQYHGAHTKYLQSDRPHPGKLIHDWIEIYKHPRWTQHNK